ncbi:hypothetical protein [Saccharopolyspora pogona]|uniref:hypothetical protein n=1 Tax=Saccharopolyspora pogona TaxID=333966 RepID=UPI001CC2602F|nr:hypothetical protein [Saccharopolyspora pogona]
MATRPPNAKSETGRTSASRSDRSQGASENAGGPRTATVKLPFGMGEFRRPEVHIPGQENVAGVVNTVRENLPAPLQLAFYGGLGALAALSVIEWPVAAAIGVGTVVAQRASEGTSGSAPARSGARSDRTSA